MILVTIVMNTLLLLYANEDRSWGAFGVAIFIGPASNCVLALVAACCGWFVKQLAGGASVAPYLIISIGAPIVAIFADFVIVLSMDISGC